MADDIYDGAEGGGHCESGRPVDRPSRPLSRLQTVAKARLEPVATPDAAAIESTEILQDLRTQKSALEARHDQLQRMQTELVCSHAHYHALFNDGPIAHVITDDRWRITDANKRAIDLFGPELPGRLVLSLKVDGQLTHFLASLRFGDVERADALPLRGPGGIFYARVVARRIDRGFVLAIEDVSESRQAQQALLASQIRLQRMLAASPDGIAVVRHNRVLFVNPAMSELLGASQEALLRRAFNANLTPGTPTLDDTPCARIELHMQDSTGASLPVECHTVEIEYEGHIAMLVTCRDLTERRRIEAKLAQSERLANMGMLIAGVAHELNNPLTYVHANLDMLVEQFGDETPELRRLAEEARLGTQRLANIVTDLRTFEVGGDEIAPVCINAVVTDAIRMAMPKTEGVVRITPDLGQLPSIRGAGERLGQVVLNLIINASMAMPPARATVDNRIWIRTYATQNELCISIQDNGVGIAADDLQQLFDPFFTTRKCEGGTGLGLTISSSLIQRMGGFIDVQSEAGDGARFVVHLPHIADKVLVRAAVAGAVAESIAGQVAAAATVPSPPVPQPDGTLRILIVEDEPSIAMVLERVLCDLGTVELIESGSAAIRHLSEGADFDVILSDLMMPDGNGEELAAWVASNRPELVPQFVMMSGMPQVEFPAKRAVLRKPFNIGEVRTLVARLGAQARTAGARSAAG